MQDYVFYARPSEVWAVEFSNLSGDRVVEVVGTEYAARQAAEQYEAAEQFGVEAAVLLCSTRSLPKQSFQVETRSRPSSTLAAAS
jgi:hypothetical protein